MSAKPNLVLAYLQEPGADTCVCHDGLQQRAYLCGCTLDAAQWLYDADGGVWVVPGSPALTLSSGASGGSFSLAPRGAASFLPPTRWSNTCFQSSGKIERLGGCLRRGDGQALQYGDCSGSEALWRAQNLGGYIPAGKCGTQKSLLAGAIALGLAALGFAIALARNAHKAKIRASTPDAALAQLAALPLPPS